MTAIKRTMIILSTVLLFATAVTACGQKGDLYLPSEDEKSENSEDEKPDKSK